MAGAGTSRRQPLRSADARWFAARATALPRVESVVADTCGGVRVALAGGFALEVFPDDSLDGERWRLLQPGARAAPFVVNGAGLGES